MRRHRPGEDYTCNDPPCIHVVYDEHRKIFKVFVEDYNVIIPIPVERFIQACGKLRDLRSKQGGKGYREAVHEEVDYLARKYLEAEPYTEEIKSEV